MAIEPQPDICTIKGQNRQLKWYLSPGKKGFVMSGCSLNWLDWTVLMVYLVGIFLLGAFFSKRQTTTSEFFVASKRMPWLLVTFSVVASLLSGISYIGQPARSFRYDSALLVLPISLLLVTPIIAYIFLPFYRRLDVTSAYEYLEKRFDLNVRLFASALFLGKRFLWMALVTLAPSIVLSTFTGIKVEYCILIIGLIATIYTALGGITAVIWTDAIQYIILIVGQLLIIIYIVIRIDGGLVEVCRLGYENQKAWVSMDFDMSRLTFWTMVISGISFYLSDLGADQVTVQRLLTTKDQKSAQKSLWWNLLLKTPGAFIITGMGVALWVYYYKNPHLLGLDPKDYDKIVPYFVVRELPSGISGLVIAAIFAAAMSSFDSGLNCIVTIFIVDWYERVISPGQDDKKYLFWAKALSYIIGIAVTILAILIYQTGIKSIIDTSNKYLGFFGGALLALFMLGIFTRRAKALPTILAGIFSVGVIFLLDHWNKSDSTGETYNLIHPYMYLILSCAITMALGYLGSLIGPQPAYEKIKEFTLVKK